MLLFIDNYDSFTYNLVQYAGRYYSNIKVVRNDKTSIAEIESWNPKGIIISPGPKSPKEAGLSCTIIEKLYQKYPIFGVCLGHQSIGHVFGGNIVRADIIMHGKISTITHDQKGIFTGIQSPLEVVRYHSLVIQKDSIPAELEISAQTDDGVIMAVRHKNFPSLEGVQFHPESIKTENGHAMMENFLKNNKII